MFWVISGAVCLQKTQCDKITQTAPMAVESVPSFKSLYQWMWLQLRNRLMILAHLNGEKLKAAKPQMGRKQKNVWQTPVSNFCATSYKIIQESVSFLRTRVAAPSSLRLCSCLLCVHDIVTEWRIHALKIYCCKALSTGIFSIQYLRRLNVLLAICSSYWVNFDVLKQHFTYYFVIIDPWSLFQTPWGHLYWNSGFFRF